MLANLMICELRCGNLQLCRSYDVYISDVYSHPFSQLGKHSQYSKKFIDYAYRILGLTKRRHIFLCIKKDTDSEEQFPKFRFYEKLALFFFFKLNEPKNGVVLIKFKYTKRRRLHQNSCIDKKNKENRKTAHQLFDSSPLKKDCENMGDDDGFARALSLYRGDFFEREKIEVFFFSLLIFYL